MKTKPMKWQSLKTGNEFDYHDYNNHGAGGIKCSLIANEGTKCFNDLPKDEYPYAIIYEPETKALWQK